MKYLRIKNQIVLFIVLLVTIFSVVGCNKQSTGGPVPGNGESQEEAGNEDIEYVNEVVKNARIYYPVIKNVLDNINEQSELSYIAVETPELYTSSNDALKSWNAKNGVMGIQVSITFENGSCYYVSNTSYQGLSSSSYGKQSFFEGVFSGKNDVWRESKIKGIWYCTADNSYAIPVVIEDYMNQGN